MNDNDAVVFECTFTPARPSRGWDSERKAKWAKERAWYTCNNANGKPSKNGKRDVMEYMLDDLKTAPSDDDMLFDQAAERLGIDVANELPNKNEALSIQEYMTRFDTLGAFNLGGAMTKGEVNEWRENIQKTKSCVWHGILSLPFKQSLDTDIEKMQSLIRQTFGGFLKNASFNPDNIALMCVMHKDKPHKHVHFTFYEKQPKYIDKHGKEHYTERCKIQKDVLQEYRRSATAYLDEHKADFYTYRNEVLRELRTITSTAASDGELYAALSSLAIKLPQSGRLQYNSENVAPYRGEIDRVAMMLLRRNPAALEAHKNALDEIARRARSLNELKGGGGSYAKKLTDEYTSRLGNVVLSTIKQMQFYPKAKVGGRDKPTSKKQHKANSRRMRENGFRVIRDVVRQLDSTTTAIRADFTAELHRAEQEIEQNQRYGG